MTETITEMQSLARGLVASGERIKALFAAEKNPEFQENLQRCAREVDGAAGLLRALTLLMLEDGSEDLFS